MVKVVKTKGCPVGGVLSARLQPINPTALITPHPSRNGAIFLIFFCNLPMIYQLLAE